MVTTSVDIVRKLAAQYHCLMSREQIHALADIITCKKYKKGERILDEKETCKAMLYLEKGMTRQFYFKYDKDLTEHIAYEGGIVVYYQRYVCKQVALYGS